ACSSCSSVCSCLKTGHFLIGIYLFSLQGGNHLLQMLWQSNPVTLCCPMSTQASQSPMDPPLQPTAAPTAATSSTASKLPPQNQQQTQLMQQQQLMHSYFMYPGYSNPFMPVKAHYQTTEAPTTEATSSTASKLTPQNQQQQQQLMQQQQQQQ